MINEEKLEEFKKYCMKRCIEERKEFDKEEIKEIIDFFCELVVRIDLGDLLEFVSHIDRYRCEFENLNGKIPEKSKTGFWIGDLKIW